MTKLLVEIGVFLSIDIAGRRQCPSRVLVARISTRLKADFQCRVNVNSTGFTYQSKGGFPLSRNFYVRTDVKITRQWKSTLKLLRLTQATLKLLRLTQAVHTISCILFTHVKPAKFTRVTYVKFTGQWKSTSST